MKVRKRLRCRENKKKRKKKKDFDKVREYTRMSDERFLEAQDMSEFKDRKEQLNE